MFFTKVDVQDDSHSKSLSNMPQEEISFVFFVCSCIDQHECSCRSWHQLLDHLHNTQKWWSRDLNPARMASRQIFLPTLLHPPLKRWFIQWFKQQRSLFLACVSFQLSSRSATKVKLDPNHLRFQPPNREGTQRVTN